MTDDHEHQLIIMPSADLALPSQALARRGLALVEIVNVKYLALVQSLTITPENAYLVVELSRWKFIPCEDWYHISSVAIAPDGRSIAAKTAGQQINIMRSSDGVLLTTLTVEINTNFYLAFSPDSQILSAWAGDIYFWHSVDGRILARYKPLHECLWRYCQMLWIASHQAAIPEATVAMVLFD
ncbi:MAG: WD40 repeat domain-containing protein [Anaerolineae bacterium]